MDQAPVFYQHTKHNDVDTYTRAEWDEDTQEYFHTLITKYDYDEAKANGEIVHDQEEQG